MMLCKKGMQFLQPLFHPLLLVKVQSSIMFRAL